MTDIHSLRDPGNPMDTADGRGRLAAEYADQADRLIEALNARMVLRNPVNITSSELDDWIAKAEGAAQALRDIRLLRLIGARV